MNECTKSIEILSFLEKEQKVKRGMGMESNGDGNDNSKNNVLIETEKLSLKDQSDRISLKVMLGEGLWTRINISKNSKVKLWLGANSMVEFTYSEAIEAMKAKEGEFKEAVVLLDKDIEWLRCQITTVEVNMGRLYQMLSIQSVKRQQAQEQSKAKANIQLTTMMNSNSKGDGIEKDKNLKGILGSIGEGNIGTQPAISITPEQAQKLADQLNTRKF